jgi:hypothetical protein
MQTQNWVPLPAMWWRLEEATAVSDQCSAFRHMWLINWLDLGKMTPSFLQICHSVPLWVWRVLLMSEFLDIVGHWGTGIQIQPDEPITEPETEGVKLHVTYVCKPFEFVDLYVVLATWLWFYQYALANATLWMEHLSFSADQPSTHFLFSLLPPNL